jgi:DNA topoisomerase I
MIICEKPSVAKRIAQALSTHYHNHNNNYSDIPLDDEQKGRSVPSSLSSSATSFPIIRGINGQNYVICHALGHLYGLSDSNKGNKKTFPVLDPTWLPLSRTKGKGSSSKFLAFKIEKILREISEISKNASGFIHACDYDQEGEVIGYNILEYACHQKYSISKRAKFSSLTDEEIVHSFNNLLPPNEKLKDAGTSRHMIDFIYGINLSRALTNSVKKKDSSEEKKKGYQQLSIGRVQGPTLAFVVEREKEIESHIFEPYWNVTADFVKNNQIINTYYYPQRIDSKSTAENIIRSCKNQLGKVTDINIQKTSIKPPIPFNLGDLQKEAYRVFRFTPSYTLLIAEKLYLAALISYPRTSSQKLPSSINYEKIIKSVSRLVNNNLHQNSSYDNKTKSILSYADISSKLLSEKVLKPNEGKETDPAHPAIYPTGQKPKQSLEDSEIKLLDLIIRRFLSSFGEQASSSQISVTITVKDKFTFKAEEKKIVFEGWIEYYRPYFDLSGFVNLDSLTFLKTNDILKNAKMDLVEKFTQPPPRYNQSTLLQKMEREKIGTKATRSEIISTLFKRNYITNFVPSAAATKQSVTYDSKVSKDVPISNNKKEQTNKLEYIGIQKSGLRPTEIGIAIVNSMKKYIPNIVSTTLTRDMETQLEQIESGNITSVQVVDNARNQVKVAIQSFNLNNSKIGQEISSALEVNRKTITSRNPTAIATLGTCPVCKSGNLIIKKAIKSKKRFAGCTNYSSSKCLATSPLPQKGTIKSTEKKCEKCNWPIISGSGHNEGKRYQWEFCINSQCPLKISSNSNKKNAR